MNSRLPYITPIVGLRREGWGKVPFESFFVYPRCANFEMTPNLVTIVALKFSMSSHFPLPKNFALFVLNLSNGTSRAKSDRNPKTNELILPSPIFECGSLGERE